MRALTQIIKLGVSVTSSYFETMSFSLSVKKFSLVGGHHHCFCKMKSKLA